MNWVSHMLPDELLRLKMRLEVLDIEGGQFRERDAVLRRIQTLEWAMLSSSDRRDGAFDITLPA
jgi:hypothetical protein